MASTPQFVTSVKTPAVSIANADATAYKSLMTAGASGSRADAITVVNSDSGNAYTLKVAIQIGGTDYQLGEVPIAAGAGTNGSTKAINLLNSTDLPMLANSDGSIYLQASAVLRVGAKTTVSGVNTLTVAVVAGGDY